MPMLAKLAQEYGGKFVLAKVNTDQERELARQYGVRNLPTVKFFRHGKVVEEFMGAQSEGIVRGYLNRHITRQSDQLRQQAAVARELGDLDVALLCLRQALEQEPTDKAISLDLARLLVERGELAEAKQLLHALPDVDPEVHPLIAFIDFAEIAQNADRRTLEANLAENPANEEARYCLAAVQILAREYAEAMENLLEIVRRDRAFREDGARKALITVFDLLGAEDNLVVRYRRRLVGLLH